MRRISSSILILVALIFPNLLDADELSACPVIGGNRMIPSVLESREQEAINLLQSCGFKVEPSKTQRVISTIEIGRVARQEPVSGTFLPSGSIVTLGSSAGAFAPNLLGLTFDDAGAMMDRLDLKLVVSYAEGNAPKDTIISQRPYSPGDLIDGTMLIIEAVLSKGPPPLPKGNVPYVANLSARQAESTLARAGFIPEQEILPPQYSYYRDYGPCQYTDRSVYAVSTVPPAGSIATLGSKVQISVRSSTRSPSSDCRPTDGNGIPVLIE